MALVELVEAADMAGYAQAVWVGALDLAFAGMEDMAAAAGAVVEVEVGKLGLGAEGWVEVVAVVVGVVVVVAAAGVVDGPVRRRSRGRRCRLGS